LAEAGIDKRDEADVVIASTYEESMSQKRDVILHVSILLEDSWPFA
jgi:hypothetical protein